MSGFAKILVANRGEIACRVMRTARAMGYRTVAVYSEADHDMPHVALADQAVPIGPAPAGESYLAIAKILAAARRAGADAIHPGYGFLSENPAFAEACVAADLAFIGPPAAAIRAMGNKAAAKRRMVAAGVSCVAGYDGAEQSDKALARAAAALGFPIMVKAAAGGGGKGMRLVGDPARLTDALRSARSEAQKAFGSPELILEKAIADPRHVEIQVFADGEGDTIHLGERDCSIQRRHQKVIEEAPSPALTPELRQAMGEAAVRAAESIGYVGAGTVEFLLAPDGAFYFLEMNTRLQVEHAVTEMLTGLDLVEWQIRIAAGEALPLRQDELASAGHAIEARLYAEDPAAGFLPQSGRLLAWQVPEGPGIRVDHGVAAGVAISPHYDPLLAKFIAHGATREEARRRLAAALANTVVLGIATNRRFLVECLSHPAFVAGATDTGFIERHMPATARANPRPDARMVALAAVLFGTRGRPDRSREPRRSPGSYVAPIVLRCCGERIALRLAGDGGPSYRVDFAGESSVIALSGIAGSRVRFLADGLAETAHYAWDGDLLHLDLDGVVAAFEDVTLAPRAPEEAASGGTALAPIAGTVVAVRVSPGDPVRKGACLVVLEAMKMEHEILAPRDARIASVHVAAGDPVPARKLLVELDALSREEETSDANDGRPGPPDIQRRGIHD